LSSQNFFSVRYKFTIFFLCVVFIPIIVISAVSIIKSSKIIQDKFRISNLINTKQTGNNIEFVLNDTRQLSLDIIKDNTIHAFLEEIQSNPQSIDERARSLAEEWLFNLADSKSYTDSIYIRTSNGTILYAKNPKYKENPNIDNQIRILKGRYLWQAESLENSGGSKTSILYVTRTLNDINNISNELGVLRININENKISSIFKNNLLESGENFYLVDQNNNIISSLQKDVLYKPIEQVVFDKIVGSPEKYGSFTANIQKENMLLTFYKLDNTSWFLVTFVPSSNLLKEIEMVRIQIFLSILISFFVFSILTIIFLNKFLSPLKDVRRVMKEFQTGNFNVRLNISGNDEIALLGSSFNQMSSKVQDLMNQVYLVKIKQKEAELKALQEQINPHFLYNTLDTIYWMSRMEKAYKTSQLIHALSKLFRLSLNHGYEYTTVENELEHLKNYILIQEMRYEGMIKFSIDVSEDTLNCKVIKLILQPLVENAIYHGVEPRGENGLINIKIFSEQNILVYKVHDNGVGIDDTKIQEILRMPYEKKSDFGFALKNVNDRIKLHFGEEFGITFTSFIDSGTTVIVRQPIERNEE